MTLYTWGQILCTFKSRQRAWGAMAALYSGARINIDNPKVIINRMNKKYRYIRIDACFRVVILLSSLCIAVNINICVDILEIIPRFGGSFKLTRLCETFYGQHAAIIMRKLSCLRQKP